ncbi:hypothetical protein L218DRAFT_1009432 [Marasmius fiardii PR-910]|nr:hypothetical protein L218DRAFT_1009432 [Marasmius fiardii PR-910]
MSLKEPKSKQWTHTPRFSGIQDLKRAAMFVCQMTLLFPNPLGAAHSWALLAITVVICIIGMALFALLKYVRHDLHVPDIPGPVDGASWLYGDLLELLLPKPYGKLEFKWQEQYGPIYRLKGCFSEDLLLIFNPAAL